MGSLVNDRGCNPFERRRFRENKALIKYASAQRWAVLSERSRDQVDPYSLEIVDDAACIAMMEEFIRTRPELWNEDIGR